MSVLIKGMEMPKNIGVIVTIYPDGHVDKMADSLGGKTEQFKAVPVPTPHGRLVDADEITKDMNTFQDSFVINVSNGRKRKQKDGMGTTTWKIAERSGRMSRKKHRPCSYMIPSVDGRRKTTIKQHKEKERIAYAIRQLEKFSKMYGSIYEKE